MNKEKQSAGNSLLHEDYSHRVYEDAKKYWMKHYPDKEEEILRFLL